MADWRPLSDPKVNKEFFEYLAGEKPTMEVPSNYYTAKFHDGWVGNFSVHRDTFYFLNTEIKEVSDFTTDFDGEAIEFGSQDFKDYITDHLSDVGGVDATGLKLDSEYTEDGKYIDHCASAPGEYYIVADKVFFRTVSMGRLWGHYDESKDPLLNVDLTKFVRRHYDKESGEVLIHYTTSENIFHMGELDHYLLRDWVRFTFLSQIFNVKHNPFEERDGLIHYKDNLYIGEWFDIPPQIIDFERSVKDLQISQRYADHENLNV